MRTASRPLGLLLVVALTACSGSHQSGPTLLPQAPGGPANTVPQSAATGPVSYGAEALVGAVSVGSAQLGTVDIGVLVKLHDPVGLMQYAADVSNPHSGRYRQFLAPDQIADRFGASKSDYQAVAQYFHSKGLAVMGWRQRELLRVRGPQAAVEAALGAYFGDYRKNGITFHSLTKPPLALTGMPVTALIGTTNYARLHKPFVKVHSASAATGFSPQQIAAAFDYNGAYAAGYTGAGVRIGIIGTGPISQADLPAYKATYNLAGTSTITQVNVTNAGAAGNPLLGPPANGFAPPPPTTPQCTIPATGPDAACNPEDVEAQLDTQQSASLARDANVLFYLAYAPNGDGKHDNFEGIQLVDYEVQQAISDNAADVLSLSYGIGEEDDVGGDFVLVNGMVDPAHSIGPTQFATLVAMGVAVFVSSGDNGALGCERDGNPNTTNDLCVSYPATDENVVAVGGINTPLANNGRFIGPATGWGIATGVGASGGGVSRYFPIPAYQVGAAGVLGATRNTPDIALEGDTYTGVSVIIDAAFPDAAIGSVGGTSVAAPESAGMWALVLQACKANAAACTAASPGTGGVSYRLGNPDPLFYQKIYANPSLYAATFYDIVFGDNSQPPACTTPPCPTPPAATPTPVAGYVAGTGYDRVTGIGVPFGRALIKAVVGV